MIWKCDIETFLDATFGNRPQLHVVEIVDMATGCSISQNFASVIFQEYLNSDSVDSILPRNLSTVP